MFDNKVATKIARIWNPLQLCGNPFRAFRLNFVMVNCKIAWHVHAFKQSIIQLIIHHPIYLTF